MARAIRRGAVAGYRLLLHAYPTRYRRRFGGPMVRTFTELCEEQLTGPAAGLRITLREYPSLLIRGLQQRIAGGAPGGTGPSRAARRARGDTMGDGWLAGVARDVMHGARMLRRRPAFTVVVVVTLMLGIGMNTAIFSVLYGVLLQPLPFEEPERLVRAGRGTPTSHLYLNPISPSEFRDLAPRLRLVEHLTAVSPASRVLTAQEEPAQVSGLRTSVELFDLLGATPQRGRFFTEADAAEGAPPVVVISDAYWRDRLGGDPGAVGRTIELSGTPYEVVGIAPPGFAFGTRLGLDGSEFWEPLVWTEEQLAARHTHYLQLFGRLAPGADLAAANQELAATWSAVIAADPDNHLDRSYETEMRAEPLLAFQTQTTRQPLLFLAGAVALVLAIACVNVANLLLANADSRRHELVVRAALGAGRGRLVRQFLTEALLVTAIGGALGLALADFAVRGVLARFPSAVPRVGEIGLQLPVVGFALAVSLLTALVLGAVGALQADLGAGALKEHGRGGSGGASWLRSGLVVVEIALALVLVIGAGLLIRSFWKVQAVDLGFDAERLVAVNLTLPAGAYEDDASRAAFYRTLTDRLETEAAIESVAMTDMVPIRNYGNNLSGIHPVDDPERRVGYVELRGATPGFHETMGIPLVHGRLFDDTDVERGGETVVINQTLSRELFDEAPAVGRRIVVGGNEVEVVGVVGDIRDSRPDREVRPHIYWPAAWSSNLMVRARGDAAELLPQLRAVVREVEPGARVYRAETLPEIVDRALGDRRFNLLVVSLFAAVALALGAVGIYGVMSYVIEGRMRDFGIRMAIGARAHDIRVLVLRSAGALAAIGLVVGVVGAFGLRRFVASMLFEVDPGDPVVYAAVASLMAAIAALACWLPARRAASADPVATLRQE